MTENRLDDLMIITCESDIADELDLDLLANSCQSSECGGFPFENFAESVCFIELIL